MKYTVSSLLISLLSLYGYGQVRFYAQYEALPYADGTAVGYSVSTGIKLDPNKELLLGIGINGQFSPRSLQGTLDFDRSFYSLGFNYYQNRKLYYHLDVTFNIIDELIQPGANPIRIAQSYFFDYQLDITYILFRRLHIAAGVGVIDVANIVRDNVENLFDGGKVNLSLALSARLFLFQIKF